MRPPPPSNEPGDLPVEPIAVAGDEVTGLPGLRTWRAVYAFVILVFVVIVAVLAALPRIFS